MARALAQDPRHAPFEAMWERLDNPRTADLARETCWDHAAPVLADLLRAASTRPWAARLSAVTSLGRLYLTSKLPYGDRVAAGSISLSVTKDGDRKIGLSYHPPHLARPVASAVVATQDEALAALEGMVARMLADHGAPGPEELSTDRDLERPQFDLGASVRVVVNERNLTPHTGVIARRVWHHKYGCWTYFLSEGGRPVKKRYFAEDLEAVQAEA